MKGETELVQLWQQPYCRKAGISNLEIPRRLQSKEVWLSEGEAFDLVKWFLCTSVDGFFSLGLSIYLLHYLV